MKNIFFLLLLCSLTPLSSANHRGGKALNSKQTIKKSGAKSSNKMDTTPVKEKPLPSGKSKKQKTKHSTKAKNNDEMDIDTPVETTAKLDKENDTYYDAQDGVNKTDVGGEPRFFAAYETHTRKPLLRIFQGDSEAFFCVERNKKNNKEKLSFYMDKEQGGNGSKPSPCSIDLDRAQMFYINSLDLSISYEIEEETITDKEKLVFELFKKVKEINNSALRSFFDDIKQQQDRRSYARIQEKSSLKYYRFDQRREADEAHKKRDDEQHEAYDLESKDPEKIFDI